MGSPKPTCTRKRENLDLTASKEAAAAPAGWVKTVSTAALGDALSYKGAEANVRLFICPTCSTHDQESDLGALI